MNPHACATQAQPKFWSKRYLVHAWCNVCYMEKEVYGSRNIIKQIQNVEIDKLLRLRSPHTLMILEIGSRKIEFYYALQRIYNCILKVRRLPQNYFPKPEEKHKSKFISFSTTRVDARWHIDAIRGN